MKKEYIKVTEEKLRQYFRDEKNIKIMRENILVLEDKKANLEDKIKSLNLNFDINIKANVINGEISSTPNKNSYFEKSIIKQIEEIENLIQNLDEDIKRQKNQILKLEIKNAKIQNVINTLNNNSFELLKSKYNKNTTEIEIAEKLNISVSQYHRNKKYILNNIYNMLLMYGEV